jgi:DNA-directed RNA polymerase alpha subunit
MSTKLKTLKQVKEDAAFYEKVKTVAAIALLGAGGFFIGRKLYNDSIYNEILKWICEDFLNLKTEEECEKCKEEHTKKLEGKDVNKIHKIIKARTILFQNEIDGICKGDINKTSKECKEKTDYIDALIRHRNALRNDLIDYIDILPQEPNVLQLSIMNSDRHSITEF